MSRRVDRSAPTPPASGRSGVHGLELPGARHDVLPPRMTLSGGVLLFRSARRAPPP